MGLKSISFLGGGYEDIVLYLSYCLKQLGVSILIKDKTGERVLCSYIPEIKGIDPENEVLDIGCAHYTSGPVTGEYDIVFELLDYKGKPEKETFLIIVTDEHRRHEEALLNSGIEKGDVLIIRNYRGAIKRQYDELVKRMGFGEIYAIPFSEKDLRAEYLMQYQRKKGFGGLSNELEEVIKQVFFSIVSDYPVKEIKNAFKKGKRGSKK